MLFYERVEKKPIKLVVPDETVDVLRSEVSAERFGEEVDFTNKLNQ